MIKPDSSCRCFDIIRGEDIKKAVKEYRIRLIVATDAAAEGLNLQTLATLVNMDLPGILHGWSSVSGGRWCTDLLLVWV
ncbi:hypothetical protein NKI25_35265 [Mesorhizobium sp. M0808]|uniref:helicase-related protein n=1 Tax=Mesorhizobium sp. M0808 TaxID=2957002 RepID=UPI00333CFE22